MGQIVKKLGEGRTRYVWYPGERKHWVRAVWALVAGAAGYAALLLGTHRALLAVTAGTTLSLVIAGFNLGRRELPATGAEGEVPGGRAAVALAGRAGWRGLVEGAGGAVSVLLVANLSAHGFLADWVLPAVPAVAGALAHQAGMLYPRLARTGRPAPLPPVPGAASEVDSGVRGGASRPAGAAARGPAGAAPGGPDTARGPAGAAPGGPDTARGPGAGRDGPSGGGTGRPAERDGHRPLPPTQRS